MKIGDIKLENNVFLAPMAGITDTAFRLLCKQQGCGLVYTEMVSAKGLYYGSKKTQELTRTEPGERPAAVQIFGSDPGLMAEVAARLCEEGADMIDINMGCPTPKIVKNGEGAALMLKPHLVGEIVQRVSSSINKPLTVKIRKGWDEHTINAVDIALIAQEKGAAAIAIHGRTREQFYSGRADWDIIRQVKERVYIPVIGNGDIFTPQDAVDMLNKTGCDAVMIGRAARGNPWIFSQAIAYIQNGQLTDPPGSSEIMDMIRRHISLMVRYKGEKVTVREMRKHIGWYVKGLRNASLIRNEVNRAESLNQLLDILQSYIEENREHL